MKKYILSIIAIVVAVGLSAFDHKDVRVSNTTEDLLYWYYLGPGETIGLPVDVSQVTKSEIFEEVGCPDVVGDDCARGYTSTKTFGNPAPGVTDDDEHIMRDPE